MNRPFACLLMAIALAGLCGCSSSKGRVARGYDFGRVRRVAVVDVEGDLESEAAKDQVAHFFTIDLLGKGYELIERRNVKALLAEHDFQSLQLTTPQGIAQTGRILNVDAIMYAAVTMMGDRMCITTTMLDVEDGKVLWTASGSGSTRRTVFTAIGAVVGAVVGVLVTHEHSDKVAGGVAGGIVGGVAGGELSLQAQRLAEKIIEKMCKSLPDRSVLD